MTDNDDNDIELGILAEDVVRNASAEVDTMRRTSAFGKCFFLIFCSIFEKFFLNLYLCKQKMLIH